jgi:site-specific DNA-methyltransferase (adenine-specific)
VKPYYEDRLVTLYHADCGEVIGSVVAPETVALLLTDPPYGVSERTNRKAAGRGKLAECNDFPPVHGDDKPFDPTPLLAFKRAVLFGANYFSERLPPSPSWIIWDKRDGIPSNDNADVELAWSNLGGPARCFRHIWNGMIKASERGERRVHPTQKPVALAQWVIGQHTQPGEVVFDPYAGSGSVLVAAKNLGRRAIGVEIERRYCDEIVRRLAQEILFSGEAA